MHALAYMGLRAARRASQIILRAMDRLDELDIEQKNLNDFVSNIDREAEATIIDTLHTAYPDHGFLGEEGGAQHSSEEFTWIIDPLDGTLNFLQGIPHFCVSIALRKGRNIEHGIVVDPVLNEEFVASRGSGARLNGKRIRVTKTHRLSEAVLSTGIPPHAVEPHLDAYMAMVKALTGQCRALRRMGSAALDLAYTAAGRLDGFWEPGLSPWDIAAGSLLVREAGGFVGDFRGGDGHMESGNIVAANPRLFKNLITEIRPRLTPDLS
ncbi:MAG: inositol monophosphatase family protein [Pseudomonadales bacterium]|jgi:myo-inositol-1(or 4)-monophosphatase|nr:inositol monophosphatase family protein [Pseudomonadales bacterium]MDP6471631.1 inositol monophosphatase family protein [Pseudomonadales bacterium]MDP6973083.1 inositol monophosphatase family protein [Pseudomonadales bacterium]